MDLVETVPLGPFTYERRRHTSTVLGTSQTFGRLRMNERSPVCRGTLYLLHGGNGDDRQAVDYRLPSLFSAEMVQRIRDLGLQIVLPNIGTSFLHSHPEDRRKSYSSYFFEELLPMAENETDTCDESRYVAGLSMGGQAALNAFFRSPERFAAVAAHFPTLITFDYTDDQAVAHFRERTGIQAPYLDILIQGFKSEFVDYSDFRAHDPIALASRVDPACLNGKRIYFDVGSDDDFGLAEGVLAFRQILSARGIRHESEIVAGGRHDGAFVARQFPTLMTSLLTT